MEIKAGVMLSICLNFRQKSGSVFATNQNVMLYKFKTDQKSICLNFRQKSDSVFATNQNVMLYKFKTDQKLMLLRLS